MLIGMDGEQGEQVDQALVGRRVLLRGSRVGRLEGCGVEQAEFAEVGVEEMSGVDLLELGEIRVGLSGNGGGCW